MTGFRIINFRVGEDGSIGNFICHTPKGSSIVDYCLTRERNFSVIKKFKVDDMNTISDQAYLQLSLKINNITEYKCVSEITNNREKELHESPEFNSPERKL